MAIEKPCRHLLVGVSGSIHALDIHNYLYRFRELFAHTIKVIMTESAARMVDPKTVELYTDDRVFIDSWDRSPSVDKAPHIQLARWADLFVVVPATADILGKAAHGIATDLLSTTLLNYSRPIVFAPAMSTVMWQNKVVRRNAQTLKDDGHYIIDPEAVTVEVGSGDWGQGLGPSPDTVLRHLQHIRMRELRQEYWAEATAEPPMTPAQRKLQQLAAKAVSPTQK